MEWILLFGCVSALLAAGVLTSMWMESTDAALNPRACDWCGTQHRPDELWLTPRSEWVCHSCMALGRRR